MKNDREEPRDAGLLVMLLLLIVGTLVFALAGRYQTHDEAAVYEATTATAP